MQGGKSAVASAKETVANIGASAKAGMEKTKATVQEKVEKVTAHHPLEKEVAEQKKQERIHEAEVEKREAMERNAALKMQASAGYHPSQGAPGQAAGYPTGGHVEAGVAESRPIGIATGTARPTAAHNPRVGSDYPAATGTGHHYT
ncbi:18 kDa seed maturation protein [Typha latifolia]|uniref:18 kDa seed maturation protein n=1 Tax=Typha latifolia TaxID=4733 RepID=UPI003C307D2D